MKALRIMLRGAQILGAELLFVVICLTLAGLVLGWVAAHAVLFEWYGLWGLLVLGLEVYAGACIVAATQGDQR